MTQEDLAKLCKCSQGMIRRIEREYFLPKYHLQQRLATNLKVSLDQLFYEDKENEIEEKTD